MSTVFSNLIIEKFEQKLTKQLKSKTFRQPKQQENTNG